MINIHFIRHGQAGNRQSYDELSEVGREQAARLGTWLATQRIRFDHAWSGCLRRQQETAECVREAYQRAGQRVDYPGLSFPNITSHGCWDEFDLDGVYRGIGPQLACHDDEFRRQFEELQQESRAASSRVHRNWAPCDITVVRAWIENRYQYEGESFAAFANRVRGGLSLFEDNGRQQCVAVFTSATPIAVWAALALELDGRRIMHLAGVAYNTAMTVVRLSHSPGQPTLRLFQFNTVPHIGTPELLTHR